MKEAYAESGDELKAMIGDTNLFKLSEVEAEAEIMIAEKSYRGQGLGWESLLIMIRYGLDVLKITTFQAKIKKDNLAGGITIGHNAYKVDLKVEDKHRKY